jgi:hypothetical protein
MYSKKNYTYGRTTRKGLISLDNTHERMKYIESIMKRLRRRKDKKKPSNQEEIGERLMMFYRRQQDRSVESVRQREPIIYCRRQ